MAANPIGIRTHAVHRGSRAGADRRMSHTTGVPASVIPRNRLYASRRCDATASATGAPSRPIAANLAANRISRNRPADPPHRPRLNAAVAFTKCAYSPQTSTMVPPETPGTRFAVPISAPASVTRQAGVSATSASGGAASKSRSSVSSGSGGGSSVIDAA